MGRFVAGFLTASLAWGIAFLVLTEPERGVDEPVLSAQDAGAEATAEEPRRKRRGRRAGNRRRGKEPAQRQGTATVGDNLGDRDPQQIDMEGGGGEAQLAQGQIETAMDDAFPRLRRCLALAASEEPVTGRIRIGMRIAGTGQVTRVNLRGPAVVTTGEAGPCLQREIRQIRFPTFDGPEMVAHYPIVLD